MRSITQKEVYDLPIDTIFIYTSDLVQKKENIYNDTGKPIDYFAKAWDGGVFRCGSFDDDMIYIAFDDPIIYDIFTGLDFFIDNGYRLLYEDYPDGYNYYIMDSEELEYSNPYKTMEDLIADNFPFYYRNYKINEILE